MHPRRNFKVFFFTPPTPAISPSSAWFPLFCIRGMNCSTMGLLVCIISDIYILITQPKHEFVQGKTLSCASLASLSHPHPMLKSFRNTPNPVHNISISCSAGANALEMGLHPMGFSIFSCHLAECWPNKHLKDWEEQGVCVYWNSRYIWKAKGVSLTEIRNLGLLKDAPGNVTGTWSLRAKHWGRGNGASNLYRWAHGHTLQAWLFVITQYMIKEAMKSNRKA